MLGKGVRLKTTTLLVFFLWLVKSLNLLAVASDRIDWTLNRCGATRALALDISKAFDRFWHAGLLHEL